LRGASTPKIQILFTDKKSMVITITGDANPSNPPRAPFDVMVECASILTKLKNQAHSHTVAHSSSSTNGDTNNTAEHKPSSTPVESRASQTELSSPTPSKKTDDYEIDYDDDSYFIECKVLRYEQVGNHISYYIDTKVRFLL